MSKTLAQLIQEKQKSKSKAPEEPKDVASLESPEQALAELDSSSEEVEKTINENPIVQHTTPKPVVKPSAEALERYAKKALDELETMKEQHAELKLGLDETIKAMEEKDKVIEHQKTMMGKYQEQNKKLEEKVAALEADIKAKPVVQITSHEGASDDLRIIKITDCSVCSKRVTNEVDNITKDDLKHYQFLFNDSRLAIMIGKAPCPTCQ